MFHYFAAAEVVRRKSKLVHSAREILALALESMGIENHTEEQYLKEKNATEAFCARLLAGEGFRLRKFLDRYEIFFEGDEDNAMVVFKMVKVPPQNEAKPML